MRLNILFMGPADQDMEWTDAGIEGMSRFVRRLWRVVNEVAEQAPAEAEGPLRRRAHETIQRVSDDLDRRMQFHTPISAVMELVNDIADDPAAPGARFAAETAVSLLQPWAPHVTEELWQRLGHERLWELPWPEADPALLARETFQLVVQVNGKVRDRMEVPAGLPEEELVERAKGSAKCRRTWTARRSGRRSSCPGSSSTWSSASGGGARCRPRRRLRRARARDHAVGGARRRRRRGR